MKATREHHTKNNLVDRDFDRGTPYNVLLTDISYISYYKGKITYFSAIKDGATGENVAHHFSSSLKMNLVYRMLEKLDSVTKDILKTDSYLHSNQIEHYTHPTYKKNIFHLIYV